MLLLYKKNKIDLTISPYYHIYIFSSIMIVIPSGNYTRMFTNFIQLLHKKCNYLSIFVNPEHILFYSKNIDNKITLKMSLESSWFHTYDYHSIQHRYVKIHVKMLIPLLSNIYENHSIFIDILSNHTIHLEMKNVEPENTIIKSCIIPYTIVNRYEPNINYNIEESNHIHLSPNHLYHLFQQLYLSNNQLSIHCDENLIIFKSCNIDNSSDTENESTENESTENESDYSDDYNHNNRQLQSLNTDLRIEIPQHTLHYYNFNHNVYNNVFNLHELIHILNIPHSTLFTQFSTFISHNKSLDFIYYIHNPNIVTEMETSSLYTPITNLSNCIHIQIQPIHE